MARASARLAVVRTRVRGAMRGARTIVVAAALVLGPGTLGMPGTATGQDVSVHELTAAFLANFVKFAEWPDGSVPRGAVFTFCVAGDKGVLKALEANIRKQPAPAAMAVRFVTLDEALPSCQLLYVSDFDVSKTRPLVDSLKGAPVFTVSDAAGFAEAGGIAQLRLAGGKMGFAINPAAAQRVHLGLSAKLLSLATLVKDGYTDGR